MQKKDTLQTKLDNLELENQKLQQELREKNDKLLRSCADFQNYQKRIEKELIFKEEETRKKYLSELIEIYELIKKAYKDEKSKEGLKLILSNLEKLFEKENIRYIDCVGKSFDHNMHHAITTVEKDDCEDNIVAEEVKKGYMIGDKIFRPSQVIVVKNKEDKKVVE